MIPKNNGKGLALYGLMVACVALVGCGKNDAPAHPSPAVDPKNAQAVASSEASVPAHVLLYVLPEKTPPTDLPQKLLRWKSGGTLTDAVLIRQTGYEEAPGKSLAFNELAILDFPSEAAYEEWRKNGANGLGPDVIISRADVLLDKRSRKNDPSKSIFVTGVYESLVSKEQYQEYTDDYIEPNMGNQYFSGIMTRYTMYMEREGTGGLSNPKAFLVTEYADQASYDRKESVKGNYKKLLVGGDYPLWSEINDTKNALRRSFSEVYARPVSLY